ncbi:MAG TPA: TonB-dependent receptor [Lacunisphaera sp.]|nr:TonB-dependent receptor [Lacunisphaera sp.]
MVLALSGTGQPEVADGVVEFPPWVIEHHSDPAGAPARGDSFAATLGATSVVNRADLGGRSVATLAEALRGAPGVVLLESFGGFEPPRLLIRGSGLDSAPTSRGVALLVDGLSFARADGSFHSGLLDPQLFTRVEVYRGTIHAALTPAVLGGVLNAVTPAAEVPESSLRFEMGSFGARRGGFATGMVNGATTAHLAGSFSEQQGWRPQSHQQRVAGLAVLRHEFSPERVLELTAYAAQAGYDVPGPLTLAAAFDNPRSVTDAARRDRPHRESSLWRVAAQLKSGPVDRACAAGIAWQRWDDDFRQLQANGETVAAGADLNGHLTFARKAWVGATPHHLLARAIFSVGTTDYQRYLNVSGARGTRFADLDLRARTGAVSVEDVIWLRPEFALGGGVTALHARRVIDDPAGSSRRREVNDGAPRLGLRWLATPRLEFNAAVSRGVEPPTFDDLLAVQGTYPNLAVVSRDLVGQKATTVEFGVRADSGRITWNLTAYRGQWRDELLKLADAAGLPRGAVNADRTIHAGLEAAVRWRLTDGAHRLVLNTTAVWNRFHFDGDPVLGDNRLAGAPPQIGNAELFYASPHPWSGAIGATWVAGRTPVDHANRMFYTGHALLHARLGWRVTDRCSLHATVRNLLDRRHVASTAGVLDVARNPAATAIFLPGNGRSFTLGLEWKP